jgi:acetyl esterase/lipase
MKIRTWALCALLTLLCPQLSAAEKVIRLYDGPAPGSENWKQQEKEVRLDLLQASVITNVVTPTLTVFEPEASQATGAAVIICPGGGFHILAVDHEGYDVARWLASKGVTSFVLKYRLVETKSDNPFGEMMSNLQDFDNVVAPVLKLSVADGLAAVGHARKHAKDFGLQADRIGIMGFSAGGMVAASVACSYSKETRPDFVAPIYAAWRENSGQVPSDAPPIFIAAATDDQLNLAPDSLRLYQQWVAAKKSAELHMFASGGHGFGMRKQNAQSDMWIEQFAAWLEHQGMLKK